MKLLILTFGCLWALTQTAYVYEKPIDYQNTVAENFGQFISNYGAVADEAVDFNDSTALARRESNSKECSSKCCKFFILHFFVLSFLPGFLSFIESKQFIWLSNRFFFFFQLQSVAHRMSIVLLVAHRCAKINTHGRHSWSRVAIIHDSSVVVL